MKDEAYEIARNHGNDGYHRALASMIYKCVNKKIESRAIATVKSGININEQLDEKLHKPLIKQFKRR